MAAVQANALTPLYALPTAVRRRLAGPPIQIDGNTLDPELQLLLRVKGLLPDTTKSDVGRGPRAPEDTCACSSPDARSNYSA